jgi:hypothetical protein
MFTTAGFNVNRLKMFILDDADLFWATWNKIVRISNSILRTQRIILRSNLQIELKLADKMLVEPFLFEIEDEEDDENVNETNN